MRHTEPFVVGGSPDGLQVRVVDGNAFRQVGIDAGGPWRTRPGLDFLHRYLDGSAAHYNERLQAMRVLAAEVMGKAMVGLDKTHFNLDLVRGRG